MKKFNNYEDAKKSAAYTPGQKLPAGAYVGKILGVKYEEGQNGNSDMIIIQFDISEGEFKDFFKNQYESNKNEDKSFKGKTTIWLPKDDGTKEDGWTKNAFAKWPYAIEQSNIGYVWDWDEKKWKDKAIGMVFREVYDVINGRHCKYTELAFPVPTDIVRSGKAPYSKPSYRHGYNKNETSEAKPKSDGFMSLDSVEDELPFD